MKKWIISLGIYCLFSCEFRKDCTLFDYNRLELDTTQMLGNQIFISNKDTIIFTSRSYTRNKLYSEPSLINDDACDNGIYLDYFNEELDFGFNYYFMVSDNSEGIEAYYNSFYIEPLEYNKLKELKDVDSTLYTEPYSNRVVEITIENGILVSLKDNKGKFWKNHLTN